MALAWNMIKNIFDVLNDKKALIIDDSQSWLDIMSYLLKSFGLKVDTVLSGDDAIKNITDEEKHYDILLLLHQ